MNFFGNGTSSDLYFKYLYVSVLYSTANDPETANDPQNGPPMVLDRK